MFAGSGNGKSRRRGRRGSARIIVPLAVPMALGLALGITLAVSGGHGVTSISESALGASASPSSSASASPSATDTQAGAGAQANTDCQLIVPANPLSAQGLATPYQLTGPGGQDPAASGCQMSNPALQAFVQATIIDPVTGRLSVYEPLVVTLGSQPA